MNYIDYIILALVVVGFILGYKDGLIRKVIGLLGIFIGLFLAVKLSAKFGKFIAPIIDHDGYLSDIVAGIIVFALVIVAASILKRLVHPSDKVSKFANQLLGGITGVIQILFFISGFLLFLNIFRFPSNSTADKSFLYHPVYRIMPKTIDFMIGGKDFLKDYIENKDKSNKPALTPVTGNTNPNAKKEAVTDSKGEQKDASTMAKKDNTGHKKDKAKPQKQKNL